MTIAVAMIPDADTSAACRDVNRLHRDAGSKISLTATPEAANLPHLSLTHVEIEDHEAAPLLQRITKFLPTNRRVPTTTMWRTTVRFGEWIFWEAEPNGTLLNILGSTLKAVNDVRGDRRVKVSWALNPEQQEAYDRYGYPNTGPAFDPHITLGLIPKEKMREYLMPSFAWAHKAFFPKLVVARTGPFGTIACVLAEHNF